MENDERVFWGKGGRRDTPPSVVLLRLRHPRLDIPIRDDIPCVSLDLPTPEARPQVSIRPPHSEFFKAPPQRTKGPTHLEEARADIRAHDELDALDLGLDEHDPEVVLFGRGGVGAQGLDRFGLLGGWW